MSETAKEDIVEINTEPQVVTASDEDMEIEVVDDRPIEDRVPPRAEAEPAPSDDDEQMMRRLSILSVFKNVLKN